MIIDKDFFKNSGMNVSITVSASDLYEIINHTITLTRKELEQVIVDEKSEVYLSPKEVSKLVGVNTTSLWRWAKRGYLVPLEVGGKRKYRKSDIDRVCFNKSQTNNL